ncbi:AAA family ATPase [Agromyces sp. NPDC060279]|uniref:AAA family ATPase n=1 Tax=Agromyces sp. NPDC060279 TaxID=3347092 RepID=UPI0036673D83
MASAQSLAVEESAGAGKTTMLDAGIKEAAMQGRRTRVVTPTKKAADVARRELGLTADSVAKLVHEHAHAHYP